MGEEVPGRRADWKVCAAFRDWPYGQQMWAEGWGVRLGGMLGERREAGGGMSGQSPVVPLRILGRHRRGHAQARLGFSKGHLAAVYRMAGGSCDTVRG